MNTEKKHKEFLEKYNIEQFQYDIILKALQNHKFDKSKKKEYLINNFTFFKNENNNFSLSFGTFKKMSKDEVVEMFFKIYIEYYINSFKSYLEYFRDKDFNVKSVIYKFKDGYGIKFHIEVLEDRVLH